MWRAAIEPVTSRILLDEFEACLVRVFRFEPAAAAVTRGNFEARCRLVEPTDVPAVSRDRDDDHVLAAALAGQAECIISRDKDLLSLGAYHGIEIIEPAPALRRLRQEFENGLGG